MELKEFLSETIRSIIEGAQGGITSGATNRVQFVVPVMLPVQKTENSKARAKGSITKDIVSN